MIPTTLLNTGADEQTSNKLLLVDRLIGNSREAREIMSGYLRMVMM